MTKKELKKKIEYYSDMLENLPPYGYGNKDQVVYRLICILETQLKKYV